MIGPEQARDVFPEEILDSLERGLVGLEGPGVSRDFATARILPYLGPLLAEHREAIEAGIVHPDPDRKALWLEVGKAGAGEVGHLLLGDGERQLNLERSQCPVGPGAGGDYEPAAAVHHPAGLDLDLAVGGTDRFDRGPIT